MTAAEINKRKIITTIALLAMSLSFLAQITPLWLKKTDGTSIQICTAFGIETITLDENGKKVPTLPKDIQNHCVMCLTAAAQYDTPDTAQTQDTGLKQKTLKLRWTQKDIPFANTPQKSTHTIRAPPQNT